MNYYKRLLKTYITIASIFIVVISLVFLFAFRYIAYQEQLKNSEAFFSHVCEYTDSHFAALSEIMQLLSSDNHFNNYAKENSAQPDRYNRLQLNKLLLNISAINQLDCSLMVTKLTDDYYCSNFSSGELKFGMQKLFLSTETFTSIIDSFSDTFMTESRFLTTYSDTGTPLFIVASRVWVNTSYPVYIFAAYSQEDLFAISHTDAYSFALLLDNQPIVHRGSNNQDELLQRMNNPDDLLLQKEASFYDQNFTYVMAVQPASTWNTTFLLIMVCCIIALFLTILLMRHLTRRMYAPIKQTLDVTAAAKDTEDEFAFIQNNLLSLRSNIDKLEQQLQQYHTPAQIKFLHDLLMGFIPQTTLPQLFDKYQIIDTEQSYVVIIVQVNIPQPAVPEDAYSMFYSIHNQILSNVEENTQLQFFQAINLNLSEQAYIFRETDTQLLANLFRTACSLPMENSNADITVAIGSTCVGLQEISHSFLHASHLITQAQYTPSALKVLIHDESDVMSSTPYTVYYPINVEQALINAVINGKHIIWENLLRTLIDTNQQKNPYNRRHLPLMLTATIDRILNATDTSVENFLDGQKQIYQVLYACKTYEALYNSTSAILNKLSLFLSQEVETETQLLRTKMFDYIHTNYTRDISLQDLADHLNMSKNYTSSLFKEIIGRNFKDYLGEYRITKACELIEKKNGNVKLLDVAEAVGCNSSSLQRLFSHYKGMTPSEWVASYLKSKQNSN